MGEVVELNPWEVHEFPWGTAVKHRKGNWTHIFIGDQQLNVEKYNVILHRGGILFQEFQGGD